MFFEIRHTIAIDPCTSLLHRIDNVTFHPTDPMVFNDDFLATCIGIIVEVSSVWRRCASQ